MKNKANHLKHIIYIKKFKIRIEFISLNIHKTKKHSQSN